nr:hypothetical protein [uncultured Flavobacterium sp.]
MEQKIDTFFNSEADRDLWLKLNAEYQIEWEKNLTYFDRFTGTYKPTQQALHPRTMETALQIAKNQLEYDIKKGFLRVTLEEYLTLSYKQIEELKIKQHQELISKLNL